MAELNRCRIAAVLAADTDVELGVNRLAELDSHLHELANANLVELCKRIVLEDLGVIVSVEELTSIVSGEAECHLSKVVSTEAEEVSVLSDIVSCESCTRNLDHSTNLVLEIGTCCCDDLISSLYNDVLNELELLILTNEGDHNLRNDSPVGVLCLNIDSSLDNSFCLHLSDLRICYSKTATSVAHHGVELVERSNDVLDSLNGLALSLCKSLNVSFLR